jgi:hypothetical protein
MAPSETRVFSSGIAVVMDVDLGAPSGRPKPVVVWFQKGYRSSSALNLDDLLVAQRTAWPGNTAPRLRFRIVRINDETNKDLLASLDGAGSVARALAVGTGNAALLPVGTTGAYVVVGHARAAPPDLALNATVQALSQRYATRLGNANTTGNESRAKVLADLAADARFLGALDRYAAKPGVPQLRGVLAEIRSSTPAQLNVPTDGLKTAPDLVLRGTGCQVSTRKQADDLKKLLAPMRELPVGRLPTLSCPSQAAAVPCSGGAAPTARARDRHAHPAGRPHAGLRLAGRQGGAGGAVLPRFSRLAAGAGAAGQPRGGARGAADRGGPAGLWPLLARARRRLARPGRGPGAALRAPRFGPRRGGGGFRRREDGAGAGTQAGAARRRGGAGQRRAALAGAVRPLAATAGVAGATPARRMAAAAHGPPRRTRRT